MRFCDKCGSRMAREKKGFVCPKCGNLVSDSRSARLERVKGIERSEVVYVVNSRADGYVRVSQSCPECGNGEAFHWFSRVSGEHAGVGTDRTVEHFRCTRCAHSWSKGS
jgi:DNA-directed RNA polymerase subunit M/transcription elongation factor TFIIS